MAKKKEQGLPGADLGIETDVTAITETDRVLRDMMINSPNEPPKVEDVRERFRKRSDFDVPFDLPPGNRDRVYAWIPKALAADFLGTSSTAKGLYAFVNRANHDFVPTAMFDRNTGGIIKGDSVLMWTRRSIIDERNRDIEGEYNKLATNAVSRDEKTDNNSAIKVTTDKGGEGQPQVTATHELGSGAEVLAP